MSTSHGNSNCRNNSIGLRRPIQNARQLARAPARAPRVENLAPAKGPLRAMSPPFIPVRESRETSGRIGPSVFLRQMREFGCEHPVRHCLAALYQTRFIRMIIRFGVVQGAQIVPHQDVALVPTMDILEFRPKLMVEQEIQQFVAFLPVHPIND